MTRFEGGGYTGTGPRAGGLDGRGGFMAMVHPDETVIDHRAAMGRYSTAEIARAMVAGLPHQLP